MTNQNKVIAHAYLKQAIQHPYSDLPIQNYIKFMNKLSEVKRKLILLDPVTTRLIDRINMEFDRKIALNKSRRK